MTTLVAPTEQQFVLNDVDWGFYESLLGKVGNRHIFITYDRGRLELMSPSWKHDTRSRLIGMLITIVADEMNLRIKGGGSTTFRRQNVEAGLEPDQCFYIRNIDRIQGKEEIDLDRDPPPDLTVEVEISPRRLKRDELYARLNVPELWRDDGQDVRVYGLKADGEYEQLQRSPTFPLLPIEQIGQLLAKARTMDDLAWGRVVREWVRTNLSR